ncbi:metal-dependent hydrolase [Haloarchaeobius sp. TZWSO28]|uniref:metal-dependent hydrolase n=1 Tax=Haloarchaeobius sp. TZWSO28 TaxID=3446119 RepID=UPI003EB86A1B
MYAAGHVGLALLAFAPVGWLLCTRGHDRTAIGGMVLAALSATLPDLDLFVPFLAHRGPTHTVWFVGLCGLTVGLIAKTVTRSARPWPTAQHRAGAVPCLVVCLSVASHLLGDVVTPMGLRAAAPLTNTHVTLALVNARNPSANAALLLLGALSTTGWLVRSAVLHRWVSRQGTATSSLPGVDPSPDQQQERTDE